MMYIRMDDYNITSLYESQNEWVARLVNILTPEIISGFREMLREAIKLCANNEETDKYLMTLQNFMARVPKWNENLIQSETQRIIESSGCNYLEDLVSCVHIIQLKCLSCIRVGQKQKKVDIDIPKLSVFIHQVYISAARKLYKNVYLFEQNISPLDYQRNQNMLETMVKESIVNSIRENVPVDHLLKVYLEEQDEEDLIVSEEIVEQRKEEVPRIEIEKPAKQQGGDDGDDGDGDKHEGGNGNIELEPLTLSINLDDDDDDKGLAKKRLGDGIRARPPSAPCRLTFSDIDRALSNDNLEEKIQAPKSIDHLEQLSNERYKKRAEEDTDGDDDSGLESIQIGNEAISLESLGLIESL